jgi:type I restriction enzyme, S subunit
MPSFNNKSELLPKGWRWVRLGEACDQDRRIVDPSSELATRLRYLSLEHVESNTGRILNEPTETAQNQGKSTTFAFDSRHILYGKLRPYLNKVALPDFEGRCTTEIIPLLPSEGTYRDYLAWLLRRQETVDAAMQQKTGSRMPRANVDDLLSLEIPLPPPEEQKRIAAILNEQIAAVERARAAAEAQLEAAQALPAAYLRAVFYGSEAQQWPVKNLGDVGVIVSGVTLGRKLNGVDTRRVPYLRVANVKDGHLDLSDVYEIEASEAEIAKWKLKAGDLLLTEGGDPDKLGRGTFWREQIAECIHQNHIFRVRLGAGSFLPEFVSAQLCSAYGKAYFLAHAKQTTGIATINQKVLRSFPLLAPSLSTQQYVAAILNEQMLSAERMRKAIEEELDAVNKLPAALLRRAFRGDL